MTPNAASPALTDADQALREEIARLIYGRFPIWCNNPRPKCMLLDWTSHLEERSRWPYRKAADDILAGPLATLRARATAAEAERDKFRSDLAAAVILVGEHARARGEAEGRLRVAELPGIVEVWQDRATAAEDKLKDREAEIAALRAPQDDGAAAMRDWRPELVGADRLGKDRKGDVTINVPTALCWLQFRPGCTTGTDEQTRPGVGFSLVAYPDSNGEWPSGVIPRDEATKLLDMLGRFLAQPDPRQEPGTGGEE